MKPRIIRQFKLAALDGKDVIDFLPQIDRAGEQWILDAWMADFRRKGIPFFVTEESVRTAEKVIWRKKMWSERRA